MPNNQHLLELLSHNENLISMMENSLNQMRATNNYIIEQISHEGELFNCDDIKYTPTYTNTSDGYNPVKTEDGPTGSFFVLMSKTKEDLYDLFKMLMHQKGKQDDWENLLSIGKLEEKNDLVINILLELWSEFTPDFLMFEFFDKIVVKYAIPTDGDPTQYLHSLPKATVEQIYIDAVMCVGWTVHQDYKSYDNQALTFAILVIGGSIFDEEDDNLWEYDVEPILVNSKEEILAIFEIPNDPEIAKKFFEEEDNPKWDKGRGFKLYFTVTDFYGQPPVWSKPSNIFDWSTFDKSLVPQMIDHTLNMLFNY